MESSGSSDNDLITILEVAHPRDGSSSILFLVKLEFENAGFLRRGENQSNSRQTSRSKGQNYQQTQHTNGVHAGIWTLVTNWWRATALTTVRPFHPCSSEQSKPSCKSPLNRAIFVMTLKWKRANKTETTNERRERAICLVYRTDTKARDF